MKSWFRFQNSADDASVVDIHIIDVIGSWDDDWIARNFGYDMGVTARAFIETLAALPASTKTIKLHINSPGGDVQGGINIANALREQQVSKGRTVLTYIDGIAASIASVIAMAGSEVHIGDNALVMVHNPWSWAIGNAAEMRKVADILDTMRTQAVSTYQWHSSLSAEELVALMDAETWMDADTAIEKGFATHKVTGLKAAALLDTKAVARLKVPEKYRARVDALLKPEPAAPKPADAVAVLEACEAGGCPELAKGFLTQQLTLEQVQAKVGEVQTAKAATAARARDITALCTAAKQPELAEGYIKGQMAVEDVRAHLVTIRAKQDVVEIDAGLKPGREGATSTNTLSAQEIYERRNSSAKKE